MSDLTDQLNAALAGRYQIERELGCGGMATVFLAEDLKHSRLVAIKVLDPELTAMMGAARFMREIAIAARLHHPHIITLLDSGEIAGCLYYVMPHVEGQSLRQRLEREKQLPVEDAVRITREVADALGYAHGQGIVHRDIKPENILLSGDHALVADFGIARVLGPAAGGARTTEGTVLGTPAYMSPEQTAGNSQVDGRTDLYSLACVTYEMLAGQPPFTGSSAESILYQQLSLVPRPISALRPAVTPALEEALTRALAKAPADRFATAAQYAQAIGSEPSVRAFRAARTSRVSSAVLSRRAGLIVAALILAALAALGPWSPISPIFRGPGVAQAGPKDWILIAEFDGPPQDSGLAVAARDLVAAGLDQSATVASVPRDQIRLALEQAGKPPGTRVDGVLARELAYRRSIRATLEGSIAAIGTGYSIVLRASDVEGDSSIFTLSDVAPDEQSLVRTLVRLIRRLRERLGEDRAAIRATRPLAALATPSFEAYRKLLRARAMDDAEGAIAEVKEALELDPEFASAWIALSDLWWTLLQLDSSLAADRRVLTLPASRLSDRQRLAAEVRIAQQEWDLPKAMLASDRIVAIDPRSPSSHHLRAITCDWFGRAEEALDSYQRAIALSPFGPTNALRWNQIRSLGELGRYAEADSLIPTLKGDLRQRASFHSALAKRNWARAESLSYTIGQWQRSSAPGHDPLFLAIALAAQGRMSAARQELLRDEEGHARRASFVELHMTRRARLLQEDVSGNGIIRQPLPRDTTAHALVTSALWEALRGDTTAARTLLRRVHLLPRRILSFQGNYPAYIEACISVRGRHWQDVIRIVRPLTSPDAEPELVPLGVGHIPPCWLASRAWEHLDRPDSAVVYLEQTLLALGRGSGVDQFRSAMINRFILHRLVLDYARLGRLQAARNHFNSLIAPPFHPDPELAVLVEEARAALASAEGMEGSTRQ